MQLNWKKYIHVNVCTVYCTTFACPQYLACLPTPRTNWHASGGNCGIVRATTRLWMTARGATATTNIHVQRVPELLPPQQVHAEGARSVTATTKTHIHWVPEVLQPQQTHTYIGYQRCYSHNKHTHTGGARCAIATTNTYSGGQRCYSLNKYTGGGRGDKNRLRHIRMLL